MDTAVDYLEINRKLWDAKTENHVQSEFYDTAGFRVNGNSLTGPETELLKDIDGKTLLHLQCHFGQDTISLSRLGAVCTGLDLSQKAIEQGRRLAGEMGEEVRFLCSDVYSTRAVIDEQFDIVFSSYGTIGWLPDLDRWASIIAASLKPGGRFIFAEFHPVVWMYNSAFNRIDYSYFNTGPIIETVKGTYADRDADIELAEIGWNHSLGEVLAALLRAGLRIDHFEEYDYSPYACFQNLVEAAPKRFQIRGHEGKMPMMYTLTASLALF